MPHDSAESKLELWQDSPSLILNLRTSLESTTFLALGNDISGTT
jgi:hypothetical protein